jgi:hypothetical protein
MAKNRSRTRKCRLKLTVDIVLTWADSHFQRTGEWPRTSTGAVLDNPNETWRRIDNGLTYGLRGLPAGLSLARLLDRKRGVRNVQNLPPLTEEQVLAWAAEHRRRTGSWPTENAGPIYGTNGEDWVNVDMALREGNRNFPGGSSLPRLLEKVTGRPHRLHVRRLTPELVLEWADRFHDRTGSWPRVSSGLIPESAGDTWRIVDDALRVGNRGLPGGSSLARLLAERRGARNKADLPKLTPKLILAWAQAHYRQTGNWPNQNSGPVLGQAGETWKAVEMALVQGLRGLLGGASLAKLRATTRT